MPNTQTLVALCLLGAMTVITSAQAQAQVPDAFKNALDRTTILVSSTGPYCVDFQYSQMEPRATNARGCASGARITPVRLTPDRANGLERTGRLGVSTGPSGLYERCVATSGDSVVVGYCLGAAEERWTWGDGRLVDAQGRCLTLPPTQGDPVAVTMRTCDGSDEQRWYRVAYLSTRRAMDPASRPVPGPVVPYDLATEVSAMHGTTYWPEFTPAAGVARRTLVSLVPVAGVHANLEQEGYALTWPE